MGNLALSWLGTVGYDAAWAQLWARTRLDMGLTMGFIDHLVKLPYSFFLRRSSGDLMMRLESNTMVRDILATGTLSAALDGSFASLPKMIVKTTTVRSGRITAQSTPIAVCL